MFFAYMCCIYLCRCMCVQMHSCAYVQMEAMFEFGGLLLTTSFSTLRSETSLERATSEPWGFPCPWTPSLGFKVCAITLDFTCSKLLQQALHPLGQVPNPSDWLLIRKIEFCDHRIQYLFIIVVVSMKLSGTIKNCKFYFEGKISMLLPNATT